MPEPTAASYQRPRVRRGRLSRQVVVDAALELIDTEGLGGLSMRRVGQRLKIEAMSLYGYIANREALLDAVVDSVIDELWADPEVAFTPQDGWQDYLSRLAWGVRRFAIAHPRAFPLVATRPPEAPFVRPPLRSLRWLEAFLTALRREGFTDEAVLYAYRAFTSFLLGNLLLEAGARSAEDPAVGALPTESLPPDARTPTPTQPTADRTSISPTSRPRRSPAHRCTTPPPSKLLSRRSTPRSASTRRSTRWLRSSPAGWLRTTPNRSSPTGCATCSTGSPPTPALQSRSAERRQGSWLDQLVRRMPRTPPGCTRA